VGGRLPGWAAFGLIRLGLWVFAAFTVLWYPEKGAGVPVFTAWGKLPSLIFGTFEHWDADWFLGVARWGYSDNPQRAAYMPAFPELVRAGSWVVGPLLVAGVLIAFAAAIAGVAYTARIARDLLGDDVAYDTAILLAVYPVALVFTAPYSEGVFLFAAAGSLYYGMRDRYWTAGLLAGLAVATRVTGLAVIPALLLLAWPSVRKRGVLALAPLVALPLGSLVAVSAYYQTQVGDSLGWVHAKGQWGRHVQTLGPIDGAWMSAKAAYHSVVGLWGVPGDRQTATLLTYNLIDFVVLAGSIALTVVVFRRLGAAWGIFSTGLIVIATAAPVTDGGEVLQSLPRYMMVDFPLFIAGASLLQGSSTRRAVTVGALTALAALAAVAFARKLWVS
jgi:Mannosyltransferase (PIG-V)